MYGNMNNPLKAGALDSPRTDSEPNSTISDRNGSRSSRGVNQDIFKSWASNDTAYECYGCHQPFSVTRWKHHCRACGQAFCDDCSGARIRLPDMNMFEKVRVCDECAFTRSSNHSLSLQEDLCVKEQINKSLKRALEQKTHQIDQLRSLLVEVEALIPQVLRNASTLNHTTSQEGDEFENLVKHLDSGLRQILLEHKQLNDELSSTRKEYDNKNAQVSILEAKVKDISEKMRVFIVQRQQLQESATDRETLKALCEEHCQTIKRQEQLIEGLQKRCLTLEDDTRRLQNRDTVIRPPIESWMSSSTSHRRTPVATYVDQNVISYTLAGGLEESLTGASQRRGWCYCCNRRRLRRRYNEYCAIQ